MRVPSTALVGFLLLAGCAGPSSRGADGSGAALAPGTGAAVGRVRLVPPDGVTPHRGGGGSYGDRRMRDVRLVDYEHPGFTVVWAEAPAAPRDDGAITMEDGPAGARLEPSFLAVGRGASVVVRNASHTAHTVSCPGPGILKRLAPGESTSIAAASAGELDVFLLGGATDEAKVFVSPGLFTVTRDDGSYELRGLAAGPVALHAWHPRFPAAHTTTSVAAGERVQVDFALRVDSLTEKADATR